MEDAIIEIHGRFVRDTIDAMAYDTNKLTIIPSLVFLVSNFYIIYKFCHRFTRIGVTTLKKWTIREATFHSSFFYISKLWLVFIKLYKLCSTVICVKIVSIKL
ncbi:PREDICTED: uncharacterized protein LOC108566207 [Nicrophorus vespilloides]|uniref:Uncharacterized protein LOC108566207 n=1 Tax=Nicrophorus vespilloides TaxID=110193 RepID=A0ABM1N3T2_NICVS|nr:PREDICTED: uncharacterized protein LOC108566207 [Nicrophorus vespilloides]